MKFHHPQYKNQSLTTVWGEHKVDDYGHVNVPNEEARTFFKDTLGFKAVDGDKMKSPEPILKTTPGDSGPVAAAPVAPPQVMPPETQTEDQKAPTKEVEPVGQPVDGAKNPAVVAQEDAAEIDEDEPTLSADEVLEEEEPEEEVEEEDAPPEPVPAPEVEAAPVVPEAEDDKAQESRFASRKKRGKRR